LSALQFLREDDVHEPFCVFVSLIDLPDVLVYAPVLDSGISAQESPGPYNWLT
jgi:hypothetical protein